MPNIQYAA